MIVMIDGVFRATSAAERHMARVGAGPAVVPFLNLVELNLNLCITPLSGYFSPEVMVTGLSTSIELEYSSLGFQFYRTCPDQNSRCPPPPMGTVLPVLRTCLFSTRKKMLRGPRSMD
jgi:hypothetical protein